MYSYLHMHRPHKTRQENLIYIDACSCCGGQSMRQDVEVQVEELRSDNIHDAQDAAQLLLDMLEEGDIDGSKAAVPAALVSLGALPALQSLGAQLPLNEPVQQLLCFCCIAREAVRLALLLIMLCNANQINNPDSNIYDANHQVLPDDCKLSQQV